MKSLLEKAVLNNIAWCTLISELHGNTPIFKGNVWGLETDAPKFYPDLITLSPLATTKEAIDFLGSRRGTSIKDSFSKLDLEPDGYKILFNAEWLSSPSCSDGSGVNSNWTVIQTEEALARWNAGSGLKTIITTPLLKNEGVRIFMNETNGHCAGFIANIGAGVVGVSNVFSTKGINEDLWTEIVEKVSANFPAMPVVGYEQGEELLAAKAAGWTSIGPLRIWIRSKL